jgi:SAM-dependent methyltransferase
MPDFVRIYAKQEYLTPGAPTTVELIAETVQPDENTILLDLAAGKGEAAATLAGRFACRIIAVEPYDPFVQIATSKFWFYNLRDLASIVRANGGDLPVRDAAVDASYCIGGPSIVGLEPAISELARVTKPGGNVIVSDVVWREKTAEPLGPEWLHWQSQPQIFLDEYVALMAGVGLKPDRRHVHSITDWEDYFAPMLEVAGEARTDDAVDPFFADEVESAVDVDRRAAERYVDYVTFVATKPT